MLKKKTFHYVSAILTLTAALLLSACGSSTKTDQSSRSLYCQGLAVIELMDEMVRSDTYRNLYTQSEELLAVLRTIAEGDYTAPKMVYKVTISDENWMTMLSEFGEAENPDELSEELQKLLNQKMLASLVSLINGQSGASGLAAASICIAETAFVNKDINEDAIYFYQYENAFPVAITFLVGEDGAVTARGMFILHDAFGADSEQEIEEYFDLFGYFGVEVEQAPDQS